MATKLCNECNIKKKIVDEFKSRPDGTCYDDCSACFLGKWRAAQLEFWKDKNTRRCKICLDSVPITEYTKDAHGIYFQNCKACYQEKLAREYKERKAARTVTSTNIKPYNRGGGDKKKATNDKK